MTKEEFENLKPGGKIVSPNGCVGIVAGRYSRFLSWDYSVIFYELSRTLVVPLYYNEAELLKFNTNWYWRAFARGRLTL